MPDRWKGQTVACIASGPSLTLDDCRLIQSSEIPTIAVNSSWKIARFCDVIYAGDLVWWDNYGHEIDVPAERWTCLEEASRRHRLNLHRTHGPYNSGMRAIQFAMWQGASRVILLGHDCSLEHGTHWHGDHGRTANPDEKQIRLWRHQFAAVAKQAKRDGIDVINCSRHTALDCFQRMTLERALEICLAENEIRPPSQPKRA